MHYLVPRRRNTRELGLPVERITFRDIVGQFAGVEIETELSIEELQESDPLDSGFSSGVSVLEPLRDLINDVQRSCLSLPFDCSCPELDTLVSLSIQAGGFGSVHCVSRCRR